VDLFGAPASLPAGAAVLAQLTGAPVLPVTLWFEPGRATGYIHDRVPVPADGVREDRIRVMTQQIASCFESGLREHSVDWHMMQPVWIEDLDPDRRSRGGVPAP
jgi:KDO2-lipid IV(A) lauroyltransferase